MLLPCLATESELGGNNFTAQHRQSTGSRDGGTRDALLHKEFCNKGRVSVQAVESLWGDCRFIPADWGSY
jgi:hypothetical protein